jgi:predicted nucleic acid-binding protein
VALVVSEANVSEYKRVSRKVKAEQGFATELAPWLAAIRGSTLWVTPAPLSAAVCRDRDDDKFIEAALAAKARLLIVRDPDLTDVEKPFGIDILTPRQYLARLPRPMRRRLAQSRSELSAAKNTKNRLV